MSGMLKLADAALRLGIGYPLSYRLMFTRRLVGKRVGDRWYVTVESVEDLEREMVERRAEDASVTAQ